MNLSPSQPEPLEQYQSRDSIMEEIGHEYEQQHQLSPANDLLGKFEPQQLDLQEPELSNHGMTPAMRALRFEKIKRKIQQAKLEELRKKSRRPELNFEAESFLLERELRFPRLMELKRQMAKMEAEKEVATKETSDTKTQMYCELDGFYEKKKEVEEQLARVEFEKEFLEKKNEELTSKLADVNYQLKNAGENVTGLEAKNLKLNKEKDELRKNLHQERIALYAKLKGQNDHLVTVEKAKAKALEEVVELQFKLSVKEKYMKILETSKQQETMKYIPLKVKLMIAETQVVNLRSSNRSLERENEKGKRKGMMATEQLFQMENENQEIKRKLGEFQEKERIYERIADGTKVIVSILEKRNVRMKTDFDDDGMRKKEKLFCMKVGSFQDTVNDLKAACNELDNNELDHFSLPSTPATLQIDTDVELSDNEEVEEELLDIMDE